MVILKTSISTADELIARDKTSLDIFWLKDKSLTDLDSLINYDLFAAEIVEDLEAALDNSGVWEVTKKRTTLTPKLCQVS